MRNERIEIPLVIGGKDVTTGDASPGRHAARQGARPCGRASGERRARAAGDRGGRQGLGGLVALAVGRARRGSPARGRAALGTMARHAERRHDARPVEDRAPGRDRRRLRGDRLLPLQRRVHDADLRGAAELVTGHLEPPRVPAARRLRLRRLAVQLHRDRREPDDLPGADGERRASGSRRRRRCSRPTTSCASSRRPGCRTA